MRAFHLAALGPGSADEAPFRSQFDEPLVLPWFLPVGHRSAAAALVASAVGATPLPLAEVDWRAGIVPSSRRFLEALHRTGGPASAVVVVRIRAPDVDLDAVARDPALRAFEWLVLSCDERARTERLGRLRELCGWLIERLAGRYDATCDRVGAAGTLANVVEGVARLTMDPVEIANTFNHAVELELQEPPPSPEGGDRSLRLRLALDSLGRLPPAALVLLLGVVAGRADAARELLGDHAEAAEGDLVSALALLDGRPTLWAAALVDPSHRDALAGWAPPPAQRVVEWAEHVDEAVGWLRAGREPAAASTTLRLADVYRGMRLVNEGRLDEAEALLTELQAAEPTAKAAERGDYWDAVGRLRSEQGRTDEAEAAFLEAVRLKEEGGAGPISRSSTLSVYARLLQDASRHDDAEAVFKEVLRFLDEGGGGSTSRGRTLDDYARLLRDTNRDDEAAAAWREALRLKEEGGDTPTSRGITQDEYARHLRDTGQTDEAEAAFKEALRLKRQGGDTLTSRGITYSEYARLLIDIRRHDEAEAAFRKALRLKADGGASPTSRGITLDHYGRLLRDTGRKNRAKAAFTRSLRLKAIGGDTPTSRGTTMDQYARLLRDAGRHEEAEAAFKEALRLKEEGGATPISRAVTHEHYALLLDRMGRSADARAQRDRARALRSGA